MSTGIVYLTVEKHKELLKGYDLGLQTFIIKSGDFRL
jgi:hypothetical protein